MPEIYHHDLSRVWLRDETGEVTRWENFRLNFEPVYDEEDQAVTRLRRLSHLDLTGFRRTPYIEGRHVLTLLGVLGESGQGWMSIPRILTDGWGWKAVSDSPSGEILRIQLGDPPADIPLAEYWNEEKNDA